VDVLVTKYRQRNGWTIHDVWDALKYVYQRPRRKKNSTMRTSTGECCCCCTQYSLVACESSQNCVIVTERNAFSPLTSSQRELATLTHSHITTLAHADSITLSATTHRTTSLSQRSHTTRNQPRLGLRRATIVTLTVVAQAPTPLINMRHHSLRLVDTRWCILCAVRAWWGSAVYFQTLHGGLG